MAKQTINIGTRANDASGDTIRDAFDKVNDNFNEIYTELGNPGTDLKFSGATISTDQTNQNLTLDPNGTGSVIVTGDLSVSGTITGTISISDVATFVGDDSTGTSITSGETFKFAGGNNITTAVSGDTLTITGSTSINVVEITSDDSSAVTVRDNLIVTGSISGQSALQIGSDVNVAQSLTFTSGGSVDRILDEDTMSSDSATALATQQSIKAYVDSQIGATNTLTIADDSSTTSAINLDNTLQVVGATGISTAVSGSTLTITGPNLSSYLTDTTLYVVGDDSSTISFNNNGRIQFSGSRGVTTATDSSGTVTITGPDLSSYATTAYVDAQNTAQALTFVGDDSTGTAVNSGETFKIAGTQNVTTAVSGDTLTITGPDLTSYITASSSDTLTNKTIDANGTGNSITNLEVADFAAASIVTEGEGIGSNDNDTTIPTSAAVKDYVDNNAGGSTGDLTITGSTISAPSNADLTLNAGGTGSVDIDGIQIKGTSISSTDSTQININEDVNIDGTLTVNGTQLSGTLNTAGNTGTGSVDLAGESLQVLGTTNEINVGAAAFALSLSLADDISGIVSVTASSYLANDAIRIRDNHIEALRTNDDIHIDPSGTGRVLIDAPIKFNAGYIEAINSLTSSSTISVNCSLASVHTVTLAENTGFVINNLPTGGTVTLIITQDGGGSNTATFGTDGSTAVKFAGGTPTLSTAGGAIDVVTIFNDGTNYLGNIAKAYA
jgi:hypothetical protein